MPPVVGVSDKSLGFQDLDIGPDDQLYIALNNVILRTHTEHQAEVWRDLSASEDSDQTSGIGRIDTTPSFTEALFDAQRNSARAALISLQPVPLRNV